MKYNRRNNEGGAIAMLLFVAVVIGLIVYYNALHVGVPKPSEESASDPAISDVIVVEPAESVAPEPAEVVEEPAAEAIVAAEIQEVAPPSAPASKIQASKPVLKAGSTARLVADTPFPVIIGGTNHGTARVPAGTSVRVLRMSGQSTEVEFNGARIMLPIAGLRAVL